MLRARILLPLAALLGLALAAPAQAEVKQLKYRVGPITVGGYEVKQNDLDLNGIPKPAEDGFVTAMDVDVVDADGSKVPIQRIMLHHIVFANFGERIGAKRDATCGQFTALDSKTRLPGLAERFYGAGEERQRLFLPPGYGYQSKAADKWGMFWMLMNHRAKKDTVYIEYNVTLDTAPDLTPVRPYWLDVENCKSDPVFDVPGGGAPGSTFTKSRDFVMPESGRVVAAGGHVHGGAKNLAISEPDCGDRVMGTSDPTWGLPGHPFYNVKPVLHEPGPIHMTGFGSAKGFPVARGQRLRLTARYDNELPHTRVMGITMAYVAPDESAPACGERPDDVFVARSPEPGRSAPPRYKVPLTGIGRNGRARTIQAPPGKRVELRSGDTIVAKDYSFSRPNVEVRRGTRLRWRFDGLNLHNVTLANGPRGFSSVHLNAGRRFAYRFDRRGDYQLFCALHPVDMTETVKVR